MKLFLALRSHLGPQPHSPHNVLHSSTSSIGPDSKTSSKTTWRQHLTLHYTPLQLQLQLHNYTTTLRYTPLHSTALHYTKLHYTKLHYTTLHYTTAITTITLHYTKLHYTTLHYTTLHYIPLHSTTFHYIE